MPGSITTEIETEMREEPGEKGNSQTKIKSVKKNDFYNIGGLYSLTHT